MPEKRFASGDSYYIRKRQDERCFVSHCRDNFEKIVIYCKSDIL